MPRKHLVASQTNSKQQENAKIWQKLAREIKAAVKVGGSNMEANPRLKAAVEKALDKNLSRESILKNISGSSKDGDDLISLEYECYGPNGIQIIVNALTDNSNRTASNLRGYLSKLNAEIAKPNSVKMFFNKFGIINVLKNENITIDDLIETTLNFNVIDIVEYEDTFKIIIEPNDFYKTKDHLKNNNFNVFDSEIKMISQSKISTLPSDVKQKFLNFVNSCNNDEDIQSVVTNFEED